MNDYKRKAHRGVAGFPKLVSLKVEAGKTLSGPIKPTNPSVRMAYKGQGSFRKPGVDKMVFMLI